MATILFSPTHARDESLDECQPLDSDYRECGVDVSMCIISLCVAPGYLASAERTLRFNDEPRSGLASGDVIVFLAEVSWACLSELAKNRESAQYRSSRGTSFSLRLGPRPWPVARISMR